MQTATFVRNCSQSAPQWHIVKIPWSSDRATIFAFRTVFR